MDQQLIQERKRLATLQARLDDLESQYHDAMKRGAAAWGTKLNALRKRVQIDHKQQVAVVDDLEKMTGGDLLKPKK